MCNQCLPAQVRYQAQLQLNTFRCYTQPTTVKNQCTATGCGCGVIGEFGLCQVCMGTLFFVPLKPKVDILIGAPTQYQFRQKALAGELPGVHKASW